MKNKADLNSIYRMDLLKSRRMVDTLFSSGEVLELVAHNNIVSTLQTRRLALTPDVTTVALVPDHSGNYLDNWVVPWEFPKLFQANKRKPTASTQCFSLDKGYFSPKQWLRGSDWCFPIMKHSWLVPYFISNLLSRKDICLLQYAKKEKKSRQRSESY